MRPLKAKQITLTPIAKTVWVFTAEYPPYVDVASMVLNRKLLLLVDNADANQRQLSLPLTGADLSSKNEIVFSCSNTFIQSFASAIDVDSLYVAPSPQYLTARDGSELDLDLAPIKIKVILLSWK